MTTTGLDVFDSTVQKTNIWLKELMQELNSDDRHKAYLALRATLHALRDQLPVEEVAQLGAQFPMLIRGFYYEGWDPSGKPLHDRDRERFLGRIKEEFGRFDPVDPEACPRRLSRSFPACDRGEIADVKGILPMHIRSLWA